MSADPLPAIEVHDLACSYQDYKVLEGVSFAVRAAEIFFIVGGTGVGKTTLLRNLVGLATPVHGDVRFNGRSFTGADAALGPKYETACYAAAQEINSSGGVLGNQVKCKTVDTRGDPADAVPAGASASASGRQSMATKPGVCSIRRSVSR